MNSAETRGATKNTALSYPAVVSGAKEGGFSVSFPDFPEAHTQGETREETFQMALDCLQTAIEWRLEGKIAIPAPSRPKRSQIAIPVSLDLAPKLALFHVMRTLGISHVNLAEKLRVSEVVVRRMLNPAHKSKPEQYVRALAVLGEIPQVSLVRHGR